MKTIGADIVRFVRQNYIPLIVFWILLFRPQILFWLRHEIIKPVQKNYAHAQMHALPSAKKKQEGMPVIQAGFVRTTESDDDGCGNDGSCSDDGDTENAAEDDYSSDDGCNDDGSCETEEDTYYVEEGDSYSDDGCSCAGETVVTSSGPGNNDYFNSSLQIKLTVSGMTGSHKLYISDSAGNVMVTFFGSTSLANGVYYYYWGGNCGNGQFIGQGYYKIVLETENSPYIRHERSFYYSSLHGFEVNGNTGCTAEIYL